MPADGGDRTHVAVRHHLTVVASRLNPGSTRVTAISAPSEFPVTVLAL